MSDVAELVFRFPFALLVSQGPAGFVATPLPLIADDTPRGTVLLGHFARRNPHVAALEARPDALVVFQGPHAYWSPWALKDRAQAPTWHHATVRMQVHVRFDRSRDAARGAVERLTAHMEAAHARPWRPSELGPRYERMLDEIVAFRAEVLATSARFKTPMGPAVEPRHAGPPAHIG